MSKLLLFDFECPTGHTFEDMVRPEIHSAECPTCGQPARRLITGTRIDPRLGLDPAFSTCGDKWARIRVQRRAIEDRRYRDHGA